MALDLDGQLHTHPDERRDAHRPAALDDDGQLRGCLEDEEAAHAHLPGVEPELDELGVLVAVAYEQTVVILEL